jgi:hypothetical protein
MLRARLRSSVAQKNFAPKGKPVLIRRRVALCHFLLLAVLLAVAYAQDSRGEKSEPSPSPSATVNRSDSSTDQVIMKVGGVEITQSEFESTINDLEPQSSDPDKAVANKSRRRLGDDYSSVLMLSQQAVVDQLDSSPEIRQQLALSRLQILSDAEFSRLLKQSEPSENEIRRYYDAHLVDFERVRLQRIFIWKVGSGSKNTRGLPADEAKARAAAILQTAASGGDPTKLAEAFKDSDNGMFDAQPITFLRDQLPIKLEKVAYDMKVGDWAEAEDTPDRVILFHLVSHDHESIKEVHTQIEKMVQGEKMQTQLDEMKKKAGIWMDQQYFGSGSTVAKDPGEQRPDSKPLPERRN